MYCNLLTNFMSLCQNVAIVDSMKGNLETTDNGNHYVKFEGIRYAQALNSDSRFSETHPITKNVNIQRKVDCMEVNPADGNLIGEEDCLFLNIFVPVLNKSNKHMPVMIWIHGSAFSLRNNMVSIYNPVPLMDCEIIVVTLSYRLGPLGFDHWKDPPLDLGEKDQRMAIKWVLKNIHMFGGDPERITLAGESAGAVYVLHHVNGFFSGEVQRAIALSGFRASDWALTLRRWTKSQSKGLFDKLKCDKLDCMRKITAADIVNSSYLYNTKERTWQNIFSEFKPGYNMDRLDKEPWNRKKMGNHSMLIGLRRYEGDILQEFSARYDTSEQELARYYCMYSKYIKKYEKKPSHHCDFHIDDRISSLYNPDRDLVTSAKNFLEDGWFLFPAHMEVNFHAGDYEGFMYDFRKCEAAPNCTLQCKVPFMEVEDGCPPYPKTYEPIARQFKNIIVDFVHGRTLEMKYFLDDNNFFNITESLIDPNAYSYFFISEDLAWRTKSWKNFNSRPNKS